MSYGFYRMCDISLRHHCSELPLVNCHCSENCPVIAITSVLRAMSYYGLIYRPIDILNLSPILRFFIRPSPRVQSIMGCDTAGLQSKMATHSRELDITE